MSKRGNNTCENIYRNHRAREAGQKFKQRKPEDGKIPRSALIGSKPHQSHTNYSTASSCREVWTSNAISRWCRMPNEFPANRCFPRDRAMGSRMPAFGYCLYYGRTTAIVYAIHQT
jgi:hypothetical protein